MIFFLFNGTPWGKYKFKQDVKKYLEQTFEQEMVIVSGVNYGFKIDSYSISVSPKDNRAIRFAVWQNKERLGDNYLINFWSYQFNTEINDYLKEIYPNHEAKGKIIIDREPENYQNNIGMVNSPPNYDEVKDQLRNGTIISLEIDSKGNDSIDYEKLFTVMKHLKQGGYSFELLRIRYLLSNDVEKKVWLDYSDIIKIKDKQELIELFINNSTPN